MVAAPASDGWPELFTAAFRQSSNAMAKAGARSRAHLVAKTLADGTITL